MLYYALCLSYHSNAEMAVAVSFHSNTEVAELLVLCRENWHRKLATRNTAIIMKVLV